MSQVNSPIATHKSQSLASYPIYLLGGLFVSPITGVADFVVPIGEVAYNSTVTNREE